LSILLIDDWVLVKIMLFEVQLSGMAPGQQGFMVTIRTTTLLDVSACRQRETWQSLVFWLLIVIATDLELLLIYWYLRGRIG